MAEVALHPRQQEAFLSEATEQLYGGAAGGGKSHLLRVSGIRWSMAVPGIQVVLTRRTRPAIEANHLRGSDSLPAMLAEFIKAGRIRYNKQDGLFTFWNEATLKLQHFEHESDLIDWQGVEPAVLLIDELTHYTEFQYQYMRGRVRIGNLQVPPELRHLLPRIEAASNPGGVGHAWVKRTFVSPQPANTTWRAPSEEGGMLRRYIPARVKDNPTLLENDPGYIDRLAGLGSAALVRAMKDGDWDIVAGQAFDTFRRDLHVVEPFEIPERWTRFRSLDWGSNKPFSVGWWAVAEGDAHPPGRFIPHGALVRYREWYGWTGKPDTGLRLTAEQVAAGIKEREAPGERILYSVADYGIWQRIDGPSIGEKFVRAGIVFRRPKDMSVAMKARVPGLQEFHARLVGHEEGVPMLYVFDTCTDGFIRTIPDLILDAEKPEDIGPHQEDHTYDETRYGCMSRPMARGPAAEAPRKRDRWEIALDRASRPERTWMVA